MYPSFSRGRHSGDGASNLVCPTCMFTVNARNLIIYYRSRDIFVLGQDTDHQCALRPQMAIASTHSHILPVLGTAEAAKDLLEKRGEIYSSRPRSIMGYSHAHVPDDLSKAHSPQERDSLRRLTRNWDALWTKMETVALCRGSCI